MASVSLVLLLVFISLAYAARTPICLAAKQKIYKPLQLYPKDCPNNASNCMAAVYNYSAPQFKSFGPKTLMPGLRESLVYLTQDESDNIDAVVITATSYKNNRIETLVEMDGAAPGATTLVRDDPTEDQWTWNSTTSRGNFTWLLQPDYTDGVVLGHIKFIDNYCFRVEFKPNWVGAIANIVFLSGNVTNPVRVLSQPLSSTPAFFEFCSFPQVLIVKNDYSCQSKGSIRAVSLNGTANFSWTKNGQPYATTDTITQLEPGTYTVTVTVNGCSAVRDVVVNSIGTPISSSTTVMDQTKTKMGKITVTASGGYPPYSITWKNSAGSVIATNMTTVSVSAGTYTVTVTDGCSSQTLTTSVNGPAACPPGTYVDTDFCVPCKAGTYSSTYDAASCTVCPVGSQNSAPNSTSCSKCPTNTRSNGGAGPCEDCPMNTMSAVGSGVCTDCPLGTTRADGASGCTPCPVGTYRCAASTECQACPAGTFSGSQATSCEPCDPGTFSASERSSSCTTCAADSYAAAGSSSCTACPSGQAAMGSSTMVACM